MMDETRTVTLRPKLMAVDVGLRKIGIALNDPLWLAASPREVLHRTSRRSDFAHLCRIVREQSVERIVCGIPVWEGATDSDHARYIREWALRFVQAQRALLPKARGIVFWDEQYTSVDARLRLKEAGLPRSPEDAMAAAILLEAYMRARERGEPEHWGSIQP